MLAWLGRETGGATTRFSLFHLLHGRRAWSVPRGDDHVLSERNDVVLYQFSPNSGSWRLD